MSTRKKLVISLSVLSLTVVTAIVSIIGVLALINTDFTFGGSISFSATSVYTTVSAATVTDGSVTDQTKMQEIFIDTNNDGSEAMATWSGVSLNFNEDGDDVVVKFTVTNHSEQDKLRLTVGELTGTSTNATMSVALTEGLDGVATMVLDETTGESTAVIDKAVAGMPATEYSAEVVITFHITNKNKDASITDFNIPINLEKLDGYYVVVTYSDDAKYINGGVEQAWAGSVEIKTDLQESYTAVGPAGEKKYIGKGNELLFNTPYHITVQDHNGNEVSTTGLIELTADTTYTIIEISSKDHSGGSST